MGQDVFIQGGGTLNDWANLSRYKAENNKLYNSSDEVKVIFMGNSITESWSHFDPDFFLTNSYINRGISGQTTPQMLIRFKPDVVNLKPKVVVILAGINDIAGNTGPMEIQNIAENIQSMAEISKLNGIKVLICSVLPAIDFPWAPGIEPSKKVLELNKLLESYCRKNKIIYVDYYSSMVDNKGGLKVPEYTSSDDLVHPNEKGYEVMKSIIKDSLKEVLK
ncbi:MAG: SGNH/GDSL hydrolase family protein [Bacteroidota bacterium]|nr:SGNH/GDSL hydrolase family protein [Bacteroidota bacterium]